MNPCSSNWSSYGRDFNNSRNAYSECKLTRKSVQKLAVDQAFVVDIDNNPAPTVLVVDGIVYTNQNAVLYANDAETLAPLWQITLATKYYELSPVASSTYLYVAGHTGIIGKYDLKTGVSAPGWPINLASLPLPLPYITIFGAPVVFEQEDYLFVASSPANKEGQTGYGYVFALSATTGALRWVYQTTGIFNPPNNPPQAPNDGGNGVGIFGSPAIDPKRGLLYIGTGQNTDAVQIPPQPVTPIADSLIALNFRTTNPQGELIWYYQFTHDDYYVKDWDADGGPHLMTVCDECGKKRDIVVIGTKEGNAYGFTRNGQLLWTSRLTTPNPQPSTVGGINTFGCFDDENIYFASIYSGSGLPLSESDFPNSPSIPRTAVFAIRARDGHQLWRQDFSGLVFVGLATTNGVLFVVSNYSSSDIYDYENYQGGFIRSLNTKTGEVLNEYINTFGGPTIFDQGLFSGVTIYKGRVYYPFGNYNSAGGNSLGVVSLKPTCDPQTVVAKTIEAKPEDQQTLLEEVRLRGRRGRSEIVTKEEAKVEENSTVDE